MLAGIFQHLVVFASSCTVLPIEDRASAFWDPLGEVVVDLTFESSKGRPCLPLPPGLV